jgi:AcrR family transcriptional regulator
MDPPGPSKPAPKRRRRGRPAALDRERIVHAARDLGVRSLTMQAVADRLGVSDAALYHHFRNREALVSAVVDATVRSASFPEDRGQDWRAWLVEFAEALRSLLLEHPGSAGFAALSGPTSPEQVRLVARAIGLLTRSGFEETEAAMIYSLVTTYVVSSVQSEERRALARQEQRDIATRFSEALREMGEDVFESLRKVSETWARTSSDDRFRYGLNAIISGIGGPAHTPTDRDGAPPPPDVTGL